MPDAGRTPIVAVSERRVRGALIAALALTLLGAGTSSARAIDLLSGYGGEAGFGTGVLEYNDDGSSAAIPLTPAFPNGLEFFGQRYREMYVNTNGSISFGGPLGLYTPEAFPVANRPMIAAFWGDVDTRGAGRPTRNGVYWHVSPGQVVITWYNVGYYNSHTDRLNSFQIVITHKSDDDVDRWRCEFRYSRLEWTTGDASGGTGGAGGNPAQAGFDAGNSRDFLMLPGSRTPRVLNLLTGSNVGYPGVWRFDIRRGAPQAAPGRRNP